MKKFLFSVLCVCLCLLAVGCESQTKVKCAHIADITGALSTQYAIKVTLDDDDRVQDKYVGLQLKADKENLQLKFGEELGDDYTLVLKKVDYWYNLTYLISQTNGAGEEAGYLEYPEYGDRVFRFCADENCELTFRMVAGKPKKNQETGEEILVLSEPISDEVTVKMKKCENV